MIVGQVSTMTIQPTIFEGIQGAQELDPVLHQIREELEQGTNTEFSLTSDGILSFKGRMCIPSDDELRTQILTEAHATPYSVHPGATKMYKDLKERFWWPEMKGDVAKFVEKCLICQKIKAEHQRPAGELQPIEIPEWKWEQISIDFVVGLPKTVKPQNILWHVLFIKDKIFHHLNL